MKGTVLSAVLQINTNSMEIIFAALLLLGRIPEKKKNPLFLGTPSLLALVRGPEPGLTVWLVLSWSHEGLIETEGWSWTVSHSRKFSTSV